MKEKSLAEAQHVFMKTETSGLKSDFTSEKLSQAAVPLIHQTFALQSF